MKSKIGLILIGILITGTFATAQNDSCKLAYNIHFGNMDYSGDYSTKFYRITDGFNVGAGAALYMVPSFDLTADLKYGRVRDINNTKVWNHDLWDSLRFKANLGMLQVNLKYKFNNGYILRENSTIQPYIFGGLGLWYSKSTGWGHMGDFTNKPEKVFAFAYQYGLGLKYQMNLHVGFFIQTTHQHILSDRVDGWYPNIPANKKDDTFLINAIGVVFTPAGSSTTREQKEKQREAEGRK